MPPSVTIRRHHRFVFLLQQSAHASYFDALPVPIFADIIDAADGCFSLPSAAHERWRLIFQRSAASFLRRHYFPGCRCSTFNIIFIFDEHYFLMTPLSSFRFSMLSCADRF